MPQRHPGDCRPVLGDRVEQLVGLGGAWLDVAAELVIAVDQLALDPPVVNPPLPVQRSAPSLILPRSPRQKGSASTAWLSLRTLTVSSHKRFPASAISGWPLEPGIERTAANCCTRNVMPSTSTGSPTAARRASEDCDACRVPMPA